MDHDEQREGTHRQGEEDRGRFEKTREVREEQTRNISEEASEEDRRQWEKTRDIGEETREIPQEPRERDPETLEPGKD